MFFPSEQGGRNTMMTINSSKRYCGVQVQRDERDLEAQAVLLKSLQQRRLF